MKIVGPAGVAEVQSETAGSQILSEVCWYAA